MGVHQRHNFVRVVSYVFDDLFADDRLCGKSRISDVATRAMRSRSVAGQDHYGSGCIADQPAGFPDDRSPTFAAFAISAPRPLPQTGRLAPVEETIYSVTATLIAFKWTAIQTITSSCPMRKGERSSRRSLDGMFERRCFRCGHRHRSQRFRIEAHCLRPVQNGRHPD